MQSRGEFFKIIRVPRYEEGLDFEFSYLTKQIRIKLREVLPTFRDFLRQDWQHPHSGAGCRETDAASAPATSQKRSAHTWRQPLLQNSRRSQATPSPVWFDAVSEAVCLLSSACLQKQARKHLSLFTPLALQCSNAPSLSDGKCLCIARQRQHSLNPLLSLSALHSTQLTPHGEAYKGLPTHPT